jgi:hypothetical protein
LSDLDNPGGLAELADPLLAVQPVLQAVARLTARPDVVQRVGTLSGHANDVFAALEGTRDAVRAPIAVALDNLAAEKALNDGINAVLATALPVVILGVVVAAAIGARGAVAVRTSTVRRKQIEWFLLTASTTNVP